MSKMRILGGFLMKKMFIPLLGSPHQQLQTQLKQQKYGAVQPIGCAKQRGC